MTKSDLEDFERRVSLIFHGAIALTLLPFVFLYLEFTHEGLEPVYDGYIWLEAGVLVVAGLLILTGFRKYRKHLGEIEVSQPLERKFEHLFRIYLGFYLRLFLGGLILVFSYWLTAATGMVVGYVVLLFLLSLHRPTRDRFTRDLPLSGSERDFILQKDQKKDD